MVRYSEVMNGDEPFDEWYHDIVEKAELCDKRYPIKGMNIWKPYGWKTMQHVDAIIRDEMEKTGHHEVNFPLLIPESYFQKETDHIKGFSSEVYWVTHAGANKLDEKLLLRPTSETAIYPIYSLWVRSHADLPLKTFQIVNTFRYETKMTKAFIRVREIHFFEAHTCHANFTDAERQIQEDLTIAKSFLHALSLPFLVSKRPDWDKFAGADYSIGLDVLLPSMKTLQVGSIHQYRENFAKPFGITYEGVDGQHHYCHQTTFGMSERLLGALVGVHGDEKGLKLPATVAPFQIIIIPILFKGQEEMVTKACKDVKTELHSQGITCQVDDRDKTPGSKFYDWEIKGVPLRIEIGPRDIEQHMVTVVARDGLKKKLPRENLCTLNQELENYNNRIFEQSASFLHAHIHRLADVKPQEGIIELPWCGNEMCGKDIEGQFDMKSLGIPIPEEASGGRCVSCQKRAVSWLRLAKSY